ncbi:hypothetical protein ccbrp13_62870 [Ktedonobacteria bacterium brp13]|nr:hypothetical protein ccbrp13_62870 [Ktedonobacteria bacterium brp13]
MKRLPVTVLSGFLGEGMLDGVKGIIMNAQIERDEPNEQQNGSRGQEEVVNRQRRTA